MIIQKKSISSTNDLALDLIKEKKIAFGTIIIAEEQLKGRGRYKRKWTSKPGNLFCSIILHSEDCFSDISNISFAASLAILETLQHFKIDNISLKWPNDVLVDNKKISGVLIETEGKKAGAIIVGMGVNLKHSPEQTTNYPATSVFEITNEVINPKTFAIYLRIKLLDLLKKDNIHKEWMAHASNKNKEIKVNLRNNSLTGIFKGVNKKGHLLLETKEGEKITISAGDVFF